MTRRHFSRRSLGVVAARLPRAVAVGLLLALAVALAPPAQAVERTRSAAGRELGLQLGWSKTERFDDGEHQLGAALAGRSPLSRSGFHLLVEGAVGFSAPVDSTMSLESIVNLRPGLRFGDCALALGVQARYAHVPVAPLQWLPSLRVEYASGSLALGVALFEAPLAPPARAFLMYRGLFIALLPLGVALGFERDFGELGMFGVQFFSYRLQGVGFFGSIVEAQIHERLVR